MLNELLIICQFFSYVLSDLWQIRQLAQKPSLTLTAEHGDMNLSSAVKYIHHIKYRLIEEISRVEKNQNLIIISLHQFQGACSFYFTLNSWIDLKFLRKWFTKRFSLAPSFKVQSWNGERPSSVRGMYFNHWFENHLIQWTKNGTKQIMEELVVGQKARHQQN